METIKPLIRRVDRVGMADMLFDLSEDPLPCRTLNYTLPGHTKSTLAEADDYIQEKLEDRGYEVERETVPVQAFRTDKSRPMPHQFARPEPSDPTYDACNIYARVTGTAFPNEVVMAIAHKDSQSWIPRGPGAYDNGVGTVGVLEVARVLADYAPQRSLWFMWCNEEHWPWTSATAAERIAASGAEVVGVLNIDGIGTATAENRAAGRRGNVARYVTPEGEAIADLMVELNERCVIGLAQTKYAAKTPNDDDGSFIKAGIPAAVMVNGSAPDKYPDYHSAADTPDKVDMQTVAMATQLVLATVVHLDKYGT